MVKEIGSRFGEETREFDDSGVESAVVVELDDHGGEPRQRHRSVDAAAASPAGSPESLCHCIESSKCR